MCKSYLSCFRQLWRLLRGSLLTDAEGFNSSSKSEAGTGQSGIFTGVTGVDSPFKSIRWCGDRNKEKILNYTLTNIHVVYISKMSISLTFLSLLFLRSCLSWLFCWRTVFMLFLSSATLACSMNLSFRVPLSSSCTISSSTFILYRSYQTKKPRIQKKRTITCSDNRSWLVYPTCRVSCRVSISLWWHCSTISSCCFCVSISRCLCSTSHFRSSTCRETGTQHTQYIVIQNENERWPQFSIQISKLFNKAFKAIDETNLW